MTFKVSPTEAVMWTAVIVLKLVLNKDYAQFFWVDTQNSSTAAKNWISFQAQLQRTVLKKISYCDNLYKSDFCCGPVLLLPKERSKGKLKRYKRKTHTNNFTLAMSLEKYALSSVFGRETDDNEDLRQVRGDKRNWKYLP